MNPLRGEVSAVEIVNRAEEMLLHTRQVARDMQDRLWKAMQAHPLPVPHAGRPRGVLVVEDEAIIRDLLELMLHGLGFDVWLASDGGKAVACYRRHRHAIGAVLLDLHLPDQDGPATLRDLRRQNPGIGCCFMTGHPGDYHEQDLLAQGAEAILYKPFTPEDIAAVLRRLLDQPRQPDHAVTRTEGGIG